MPGYQYQVYIIVEHLPHLTKRFKAIVVIKCCINKTEMNCIELKPLMAKFIKGQIIASGDIHLVLDFRLLLFEKDFHTSIKSGMFKIMFVQLLLSLWKWGGFLGFDLIPEYLNSRIKAKKVLHRDKTIKMDIVQILKRLNCNWTVWFKQETKKSRK